jgi:hypothetical protein
VVPFAEFDLPPRSPPMHGAFKNCAAPDYSNLWQTIIADNWPWELRLTDAKGESMEAIEGIKVLFIAGFGPIVREAVPSSKLYGQVLGFISKRRLAAICTRRGCKGQRVLPCGRFLMRRSPALEKTRGRRTFLRHRPGLSSTLPMSRGQRRSLKRVAIACSSRTRKSRGGRPSAVSWHRKDCWWGSHLLRRCEGKNSDGAPERCRAINYGTS